MPDLAGSLGGGGRYDNLVGMFLGRDVPACGFSLGLERIIVVMTERGHVSRDRSSRGAVDVMVALWNEGSRADALALAAELRARRASRRRLSRGRQAREAVQVRVQPERARSWRSSATTSGAQGTVSIKDLRSGDQQTVARGDAGASRRGD